MLPFLADQNIVLGSSDLNKEVQPCFSFCPTLHTTVLSWLRGHIPASAALMRFGSSGSCCCFSSSEILGQSELACCSAPTCWLLAPRVVGLVWPLWLSVHVVGHELELWKQLACQGLAGYTHWHLLWPCMDLVKPESGHTLSYMPCCALYPLPVPCLLLPQGVCCLPQCVVSNPLSYCCHSPPLAGVISLIPSH